MRRTLAPAVTIVAMLVACTSRGAGPTPTAPAPTAAPSEEASVACELFTLDDAEELFGTSVERVPDAIDQGLIAASAIPAASEVCYYRPVPEDGSRFAAVAVIPPGALSEAEYQTQVEGGVPLAGPGDDGFEVNGSIITRRDDTVVLAVATVEAGEPNDPQAGLEIATLVVSRLPPPAPDPDNPACLLLSEALAEPILGVDLVFADDYVSDDQRSGCGLRSDDLPLGVSLRMTQGAEARLDFENLRADATEQDDFEVVRGLGDEAFATESEAFVLVGETALWINVFSPDAPSTEQAIEIARAIVERL